MNTEKLKQDIVQAIEMIQAIHDDMVASLITENVPVEVQGRAVSLTSRLSVVVWYLEHISEGVSA